MASVPESGMAEEMGWSEPGAMGGGSSALRTPVTVIMATTRAAQT